MGSQQYIHDDGDLRKYRTEIPNMADDELDPFQYRLYAHYKRVGQCWESVSTTADKCRMSRTKVIECRNWLHENGWIAAEHRDNTTCLVTVLDRWGENFLRFASYAALDSSPNMDTPSPNMDTPSPNMDTKKEPIKKEPIKKGIGPTPAQLGKRRQMQTPEHIKVAKSVGLTPADMTAIVNAVLTVTGKKAVADVDDSFGERELANAQECAAGLVKRGVKTPQDVVRIADAFRAEHPNWTPAYGQLIATATTATPATNNAPSSKYTLRDVNGVMQMVEVAA